MKSEDCSSHLHEFCNQCDCNCHGMQISDEEITKLLDYFINRAGWISFETDMPIHTFIKRLQEYEKTKDTSKVEQWSEQNS